MFGRPRNRREQVARDAIERYAFLLRVEMEAWERAAPDTIPEQMVKWGTVWLLRGLPWPPHIGELLAKYAYLPLLGRRPRVVRHAANIFAEWQDMCRKYGRTAGSDATDEWAEETEWLYDEMVHLDRYDRRRQSGS